MKYKIMKLSQGTEKYPKRVPAGQWEEWDEVEEWTEGLGQLITYIDIHQSDGEPATVWQITRDGIALATVDATVMSEKERLWAPAEAREEGQEIFGQILTESGRVDEVLRNIESAEDGKNESYICLLNIHGTRDVVLGIVGSCSKGIVLARDEAIREDRLFTLAHNPGRGVGVTLVPVDSSGKASEITIGFNFVASGVVGEDYDAAEHDECDETCPPGIEDRMKQLSEEIVVGANMALKARA